METLKKIVLLVGFTGVMLSATTQDNVAIQKAFANSYTNEYKYDYAKAIENIITVYDEKSYEINLRLGWLNYSNKQYATAIKYYQKAITVMPYSIEAKLGIILPYAALANWDQVTATYLAILKIDACHAIANYRLGTIYYNKVNYKEAAKYLDKYLNLYPFDYDGVIMSAWNDLKLGKTSEAKLLFNKALLLKPSDKSALDGLAAIK